MANLIRLQRVMAKRGTTRSPTYNDIATGLLTKPIKIGARAVAWPEHEIDVLNQARTAGKTDDEIRALVRRLHADRQTEAVPA